MKMTKQAFLDFLNTRYSSHNDAAAALGQTYRRYTVECKGFDDRKGTVQVHYSSPEVCTLYGRYLLVTKVLNDLNGGYITHNGRFSKAAALCHLNGYERNMRYHTNDAEYVTVYDHINKGILEEAVFLIGAVTASTR